MLTRLRKSVSQLLYREQPATPVSAAKPPIDLEILGSIAQRIKATYDAARTTDEFKNYWANADAFDADSAHSIDVRQQLVRRSRYEVANNGYTDGIAQTYSTDLVGNGPQLRMNTGSHGFNQMVEQAWFEWCKAVKFRRKLWCMSHAKGVDGESISAMRLNPSVKHPIKLDITLYETEQCQTPFVPFQDPHYIDGIKFDDFGNPLWYDILHFHPGATKPVNFTFEPERVPADRILHWFKMRRPGQHRGVPESSSTLNLGAAARRFREANLGTAEKVASWTLFLETLFTPDELAAVTPMSTLDISHGMMTALPNSVKTHQLTAEHPAANYAEFNKTLINEQARPKSMPYNKAACDSSSYNYASGRLDHQTYYAALDVEREDCDDLVLDPLFDLWFDLAVARFGWLGGDPSVVGASARSHSWDWPKHRVADVESEANANQTKLQSGQIGLDRLYSDAGMDLEDEIPVMAQTFGVDEAEIRKRLLDIVLPPPKQTPAPGSQPANQSQADQAVAALLANRGITKLNGNGAHHG